MLYLLMKNDFVYTPEVEALAAEIQVGVTGTADRCRESKRDRKWVVIIAETMKSNQLLFLTVTFSCFNFFHLSWNLFSRSREQELH